MANTLDYVFTEPAQRVLSYAHEEAQSFKFTYIGTEHLLLGLLREHKSAAAQILARYGINLTRVRQAIVTIVGPDQRRSDGNVDLSPRTKRVIELADVEKKRLGDNSIDTTHLLLGLTRDSNGVATYVLTYLGINMDAVRQDAINTMTGQAKAPTPVQATVTHTSALLQHFGVDLTARARQGRLDPVIGRADTIQRLVQILRRRTKNNPALVGEAGVGKTALVEGLAQHIVERDDTPLHGKRIWMLDVGSLVAGTSVRGQFEERLKQIIDELKETDSILFVDEFHLLVGAGANSGALDAASILKPMLARGDIQFIGATTIKEYRSHIEKDVALARRFQAVVVEEPTADETMQILRGLRERYEKHHQLVITDAALAAAVQLSVRYIPERFLPDKALDVIDEAASRAWVRRYSHIPLRDTMRRDWAERLEEIRGGRGRPTDHVVIREDVAEVVSQWTGVPLTHLVQAEAQRLRNLEAALRASVVGQDEAIDAVARAVRLARVGLQNANRPTAAFLFVGPTGVGKTELGKALARQMLGDENALLKFDMSEYGERHTVSRLIGAPPGYVGYDEGGQLTEAVRRRPYSVLLLDEIDKAHPDVLNLMLQVFEDGVLTESNGRRVDFRHTLVIMTANIGANLYQLRPPISLVRPSTPPKGPRTVDYATLKEKTHQDLRNAFPPEFLNRLDNIIVFRPLGLDELTTIVDILLQSVYAAVRERALSLTVTDAAKRFLVDAGYDPRLGARPLRRIVRRYVREPLSALLLDGKVKAGDSLTLDCAAGAADTDTVVFYNDSGAALLTVPAEVNNKA